MTDLPEETWTPHEIGCNCEICQNDLPCSRGELAAESSAITTSMMRHMAKMAETMRDHIAYLHKVHTVALMSADFAAGATSIGYTHEIAAHEAADLYREVQKTLEIDQQITGHIPAA